ncbi:hypothetical protein ACQPYK_30040 [Streptosporangium sp. CA-135522]|uniref:hypothetical protein n=1 Tax=Streptosporangium sp. CA-135522 TaxID=3240072 RepID=UPI003D8BAD14
MDAVLSKLCSLVFCQVVAAGSGPIRKGWQSRVSSLREITREDVLATMKPYHGEEAHRLIVALRSIFRALKQERLIFVNPTRGISTTRRPALPVSLPSDQIAGLLDRLDSPVARLAVVPVALYGIQVVDLRGMALADLDLSRGRITIRRSTGRWIIYLDQVTLDALDAWLRERHRRWPSAPHPHLLISRRTAADRRVATAIVGQVSRDMQP